MAPTGIILEGATVAGRDPTPAESVESQTGPVRRSWLGIVVVVVAGGALLFEQSPANEILRTNAALEALKRTGSALVVGLTVAAITAAIELGSAVLITFGLHADGGAVQRLKQKMRRQAAEAEDRIAGSPRGRHFAPGPVRPPWSRRVGAMGTDVAVALGLGAGLVTIRRHVADRNPTMAKDLAASVQATAIVAVVSGLIGYLAGGGLSNAEKIGLGTPARYIIDYGTDTWFWLGMLALGYGTVLVVKLVKRRSRANRA